MGIDIHNLRALRIAAGVFDVNFKTSVMLGRQGIHCTLADIQRVLKPVMQDRPLGELPTGSFSEPLFHALGAETIDSIDASDFEKATITADFCKPIPQQYHGRYSFCCDFGTIEHIFDVPEALANVSRLLQVGGHSLIVTNSNGFIGHGFYQFSPEFFYSAFNERNGFKATNVFLVDIGSGGEWLHVRNPRKTGVRSRCGLIPECYVVCISEKVATCETFVVNQSDYEDHLWRAPAGSAPSAYTQASLGQNLLRYPRLREAAILMRRAAGFRGADVLNIRPIDMAKSEFLSLIEQH
jgi:hypothetical protein